MNTEELLTIDETAAHYGISRSAVYLAIRDGRLKTVTVLGTQVVRRADLESFQPRAYRDRPGRAVGGRAKSPAKGS